MGTVHNSQDFIKSVLCRESNIPPAESDSGSAQSGNYPGSEKPQSDYPGRKVHKPLYTWEEFLRIQKEFEHRARHNTGRIYQLSGLMVCSECGGRIRHKKAEYWQCAKNLCVRIDVDKALQIIPPFIESAIHQIQEKPKLFSGSSLDRSGQLADLERQRRKIQQLARDEIYTLEETCRS